mmetsp:Transcript_28454/g.60273  ORF Transcript_28454/g.60273 Transcript_28454/m.60273 type:complete len:98 (-) Transcript_28454:1236-1529(-)
MQCKIEPKAKQVKITIVSISTSNGITIPHCRKYSKHFGRDKDFSPTILKLLQPSSDQIKAYCRKSRCVVMTPTHCILDSVRLNSNTPMCWSPCHVEL